MKRPFSATVWKEGDSFVAQCLDVDIASQGATEEEALINLKEALELHFDPPMPTRPAEIRTIEAANPNGALTPSAPILSLNLNTQTLSS